MGYENGYSSTPQPQAEALGARIWRYARWPFLGIGVLGVVFAALLLAPLRLRVNFGGALGWLLGREEREGIPSIAVSNSLPPERVVPLGQPDERGFVQASVEPLQESWNPLSRTDQVETLSGDIIQLPEGVSRRDVQDVIVVSPSSAVVRLKDARPPQRQQMSSTELLDRLKAIQKKHQPPPPTS